MSSALAARRDKKTAVRGRIGTYGRHGCVLCECSARDALGQSQRAPPLRRADADIVVDSHLPKKESHRLVSRCSGTRPVFGRNGLGLWDRPGDEENHAHQTQRIGLRVAHDQTRLPVLPVAPRVETASNGHGAIIDGSDPSCPHTDSPTSFDGAGQASSSPSSFGADSTPSSGAGGQTPAGAYSPSQAAYEPSAPPPDEKEPKKEG